MRHAFCIIAHDQFDLLQDQVSLLNASNHNIYVHVDRKADCDIAALELALTQAAPDSHIQVFSQIEMHWGHSSQVACILFLLKCARNTTSHQYYHVISGTDLPLKSNASFDEFFEMNKGREFIRFEAPQISRSYLDRVDQYHIASAFYKRSKNNFLNKIVFLADKSAVLFQKCLGIHRLKGLQCQKGDEWFSCTEEFVDYLLSMETSIMRRVAHTCCADEIFVQTALINSPYTDRLYKSTFDNNPEAHCREVIFDGISPVTLTEKHREYLLSSKCMFARKFNESEPFTKYWVNHLRLENQKLYR